MNNPTFHLEGIVRSQNEMHDFTGPLNLILMLLSKNKIEIRDLKISDLLDQYIEYIAKMQELDLDIASEFVQMASHLVYIKSRTLLAGEKEADELKELMSSLEELRCQDAYVSIKAVTDQILAATMQGMLLFPKEPEPIKTVGNTDYAYTHSGKELFLALAMVLMRSGRVQVASTDILVPQPIVYSVQEKGIQLVELLRGGKARTLRELCALSSSRSEVVATFISILEMCASGNLLITEKEGELAVELCGDGDFDITEFFSNRSAEE